MKKQSLVLYLLLLLLPLGSLAQVTFTAESSNINCESNNFSINVSVDNFTDMNAYQYSMHWDPAIIQYTSTSNNNFGNSIGTTNASNGTLQISWFSQTSGTNIPDGTTIFTLNFDLIGSAASAIINFDGNPTPIIIAQNGSQITASDYAFVNGNINFEDNTAPTISCPSNITVDAMGASSTQVASISPSGADNCGIDSYSYTLSGANNGSGVGDVSNSVNFNVGTTTVTYQAVDFGGNTETCSFDVTIENNNPITGFHLIGEAEMVNCTDNLVSVDILANNFIDLKGVQFTLNWNSTALQYIDTSNVVFINGASFGTMSSSNGVLTFSWFNSTPTTLPDGQVLFTINYMVNAPVGSTIPIPFINAPTPIQFVDSNNMALAPADYTITNGSVTIVDTQDPTIACPQDVNVNSTNGTDAIVNNIAPTANDECGIASLTYALSGATTGTGTDDASGTTFNVGTTAVEYTVTDEGGNTATCSFNVTVTTTPIETITISIDSLNLDCSNNTVELCIRPENFNDIRGIQFTINWDATALQYIDTSEINLTNALYGINDVGNGVLTYSWFSANAPASLPDGTSLFCINFDLVNSAPGDSYDITFANFPTPVQLATQTSLPAFVPTSDYVISNGNIMINADTEAPTLDCPSDVNENSGGASTLVVNNIAPTTSDNCSTPTVMYGITGATTASGTDDASGTTFNVGTSIVTYTSTDASGNSISCSFNVVVVQEMLSITCPTNVLVPSDFNTCTAMISNLALTINSSMANIASVTYTISENPLVTGTGGVINHTFELGTSLVTFEVEDIFGNSTSCSFNVSVTDAEVPVFSGCPLDITVNSAADCSAAVNWTPPTATDNCDTDITITTSHEPGTIFMGGTTTVTYIATDDFNNATTCSFDVTVADNIPPSFLCPSDVTVNIGGTVIDPNSFIAGAMMMGCDSVILDYNTPQGTDNCLSFSITSDTPDSTAFGAGLNTIIFTITDIAGNTATCEVNVMVIAQNSFSIAATPDTVCVGGTVNLQIFPASTTATYSWVGPNGFTSNLINPILTDFMLPDTGTYTVTIDDPNACVTNTVLSVVVAALDSPDVIIVSDPETLECIDGPQEVTLSGSTMDNVTAWEWIDPNGISVGTDPNLIITVNPNSTGTYTLLATGENGCITTVLYPIIVSNSIETPVITSSCNGGICVGDNCTFFGMFAGSADSVLWESNSPNLGLPAVTNTNTIMISPTAGGANSLSFTIFKDGCSATATIAVPVTFPAMVTPDVVAVNLDTPITFSVIENDSVPPGFAISTVTQPSQAGGTLINNLNGTFSYTPPSGFLGTDMFIYSICVLCDGGPICVNATVTLNVTVDGCLIPTIITPNGDGMNDEWEISCAINNQENELTVYNRWGDQVYEAAPYQGDWKGTYNNEDLPDGTYYFIYKNSASDTDPKKGYLTIMR